MGIVPSADPLKCSAYVTNKKKGAGWGRGREMGGRTYGNVISEIRLDECKDCAAQEIFIGRKGLRERRSCCEGMMNLPNKSMRPSAASRKELVSTPSGVMRTFSNDCCGDVVFD
jgi:hypothetical protein